MNRIRISVAGRWVVPAIFAVTAAVGLCAEGLEWDALEKDYVAKENEEDAALTFTVTNRTDRDVVIQSTATSCHCTVATPPQTPWVIGSGATEILKVGIDLRGRVGSITKTIFVESSEGEQLLVVNVSIPPPKAVRREMNLLTAKADRQAVLRGDCASCHVAPTVGKMGKELFQTACVICHAEKNRASMVPDLMVATVPRDAAYWGKWIREGAEGTLMPAFAKEHGGSLDEDQITSLIAHLLEHLPTTPSED